MRNCEYILTEVGRRKVARYIRELGAKRKEILDAGKDTADDTDLPTIEDIVADLNWNGADADGEYLNGWGVTDNYDSDYAICLRLGEDFIESCSSVEGSTMKRFTKYPKGYVKASGEQMSIFDLEDPHQITLFGI